MLNRQRLETYLEEGWEVSDAAEVVEMEENQRYEVTLSRGEHIMTLSADQWPRSQSGAGPQFSRTRWLGSKPGVAAAMPLCKPGRIGLFAPTETRWRFPTMVSCTLVPPKRFVESPFAPCCEGFAYRLGSRLLKCRQSGKRGTGSCYWNRADGEEPGFLGVGCGEGPRKRGFDGR